MTAQPASEPEAAAGPLGTAIGRGVPLLVVSPHLDDAALSCGALLSSAAGRIPVTVLTLFTEPGPAPHTLSARRYLHQVRAADAHTLYRQRRAEDRAALEPMGITCVHAGLTEAQFRRRPLPRRWRRWERLLPELAHLYPVYRLHTASGRVAQADAGTVRQAREIIERGAGPGPVLVLAPLGVGGHVDHVLARTAATASGRPVAYYSDFPYSLRQRADPVFVRRHGLRETRWEPGLAAKADLIRAYGSQVPAMFPDGRIPGVPDVYWCPSGRGPAATADGSGG